METFYDIGSGDFKDMWETDLDPAIQEAFKLPPDPVMQDWLFERDIKMPQVILHDKLMTDALLGTIPIKSEHSYSLNSDGDSMPDSPGSLQNKMDDMDDECYPTISMNSAHTSHHQQNTTNSNCSTSSNINNNNCRQNIQLNNNNNNSISIMQHSGLTANIINNVVNNNSMNITNINNNNNNNNNINNFCNGDTASIISCGSDIDVDDSTIKEEPLSPGSSCPPSPNGVNISNNNYTMNANLANIAACTNTDLVYEHKIGSLSSASQSLLKNQQIIFGSTITPSSSASSVCSTSSMSSLSNLQQQHQLQQQLQQHRVVIPKLNIKMEPQTTTTTSVTVGSGTTTGSSSGFGLPPTPPSSLPSDDSEGNQSPEHHLSPMSPPATLQTQTTTSTPTSRRTSVLSTQTPANCSNNIGMSTRTYNSTRQPIHTPLISSQPKGSTGTLVLTEEEKRTLQAEGYPIPTRLPLTKAEEKSLKKIRRKIKNKISAQESRRKKKEYMDQLERKVEILVSENTNYRKRVESLEDSNTKLLNQLAKLEASITRHNVKVK